MKILDQETSTRFRINLVPPPSSSCCCCCTLDSKLCVTGVHRSRPLLKLTSQNLQYLNNYLQKCYFLLIEEWLMNMMLKCYFNHQSYFMNTFLHVLKRFFTLSRVTPVLLEVRFLTLDMLRLLQSCIVLTLIKNEYITWFYCHFSGESLRKILLF